MAYQNPVALLNEKQVSSFKKEDYKKIKNEILLQFQLSSEPVILWQDRMYDKEEVIQLLEGLQENTEIHFEIFKNKPLLSFLEEGETGFFNNRQAQQQALNNPETKDKIVTLIVEGVNELLPDWILDFTPETTALLKNLHSFTSQLEPPQVTAAYSSAFVAMQSFVSNLETMYPHLFTSGRPYVLSPELEGCISREFLNFFRFLPKEFEGLKFRYCMWCNNSVVVSFAREQDKVSKFPRETLRKIMDAATMAAEAYNREGNLQIANNLDNYLTNARGGGSASGLGWIFPIIMVIIGIIRIGNSCNRVSNNRYEDRFPYRTEYPTVYHTDPEINEAIKRQLNGTNKDTNRIQSSNGRVQQTSPNINSKEGTDKLVEDIKASAEKAKEESKFVPLNPSTYNGSAPPLTEHIKLLGIQESDKLIVINYETEIFPTRAGNMHEYIPYDLKKMKAGQDREFQINFTKKNLAGVLYSHKVFVRLGDNLKVLGGPAIIETNKPLIKVSPIPVKYSRFKGFLTLMNQDGKILDKSAIEVWKSNSKEGFNVKIDGNTYMIRSQYSQDRNYPNENRMKSILHNMEILNGMSLQASIANKVFDFWFYSILHEGNIGNTLTGGEVDGPKPVTSKDLYFLFKSAADGTFYFSTANKEADIKFTFDCPGDCNSSHLKGIQMTVAASDRSVVERIELFRVN